MYVHIDWNIVTEDSGGSDTSISIVFSGEDDIETLVSEASNDDEWYIGLGSVSANDLADAAETEGGNNPAFTPVSSTYTFLYIFIY